MNSRFIALTVSLLAAVSCFSGCSKISETENDSSTDGNIPSAEEIITLSVKARTADLHSEAESYADIRFPSVWSNSDELAVADMSHKYSDNTIPRFRLTDGDGTDEGVFTGSIVAVNTPYYAVYPYAALTQSADNRLHITFPSNQKPAEGQPDLSTAILVSNGASANGSSVSFKLRHIAAYLALRLENLESGKLDRIKLTTDTGIAGAVICSPDGSTVYSATSKSVTADISTTDIANDGSCNIVLAMLPATLSDFTLQITYADGSTTTKRCTPESPLKLEAGVIKSLNADMKTIFDLSEQNIDLGFNGGSFTVTVTSDVEYSVSLPEWITETAATHTGQSTVHTFTAEHNYSDKTRTGVISFCYDNKCFPVVVTQQAADPDSQWIIKEFFHRSLILRFTATWCGYCPIMSSTIELARQQMPDKIETVALHAWSSELAFSGTQTLMNQYMISGFPHGIIDGRIDLPNFSPEYGVTIINKAIKETESIYTASSGIAFTSSLSGRTLKINGSLYLKQADSYKITVLLLEDGIVGYQNGASNDYIHNHIARTALSDISGDSFTAEAFSVKPFSYTASVPSSCNTDNLRILVYVQRAFGSQPREQDQNYGDYYVDNCISADVGTAVEPTFVGE